jgi:hypothetical protein
VSCFECVACCLGSIYKGITADSEIGFANRTHIAAKCIEMCVQETSDGRPKCVDVVDCSGSGDIDTSTCAKADSSGVLKGLHGKSLTVHPEWANPSGVWRVGAKPLFELYPGGCRRRVEGKRKVRCIRSRASASCLAGGPE